MVCPRRAGVPFCLPHKKEPKKSPLREPGYLAWRLGARVANSRDPSVRRHYSPERLTQRQAHALIP